VRITTRASPAAWLLIAVGSYLLGSIPFGYLAGRLCGVDIRTKGSGNIGATNVLRVLGKKWGYAVFLLDFLKAWLAVKLALGWGIALMVHPASAPGALAGLCALLGHSFPVWLGFRGGKGIASSAGVIVGLFSLPVFLICLGLWLLIFTATRYVGRLDRGRGHPAGRRRNAFLPPPLRLAGLCSLRRDGFPRHLASPLQHRPPPGGHRAPLRAEQELSAPSVGVVGSGAWGTALALLMARRGRSLPIWGHDPVHVEAMRGSRLNEKYLPGIELPDSIRPTADLAELQADILLVAVPSNYLATVTRRLAEASGDRRPVLVSCTKGIEREQGLLMSEVMAANFPNATLAVLSGPNLAGEIAKGVPAAGVIGCDDPDALSAVQALFEGTTFRAYTSADLRGIQLGGALKNVFAIAAGVSDGLGLGRTPRRPWSPVRSPK